MEDKKSLRQDIKKHFVQTIPWLEERDIWGAPKEGLPSKFTHHQTPEKPHQRKVVSNQILQVSVLKEKKKKKKKTSWGHQVRPLFPLKETQGKSIT